MRGGTLEEAEGNTRGRRGGREGGDGRGGITHAASVCGEGG